VRRPEFGHAPRDLVAHDLRNGFSIDQRRHERLLSERPRRGKRDNEAAVP
jgi:hypothetical protein